MTSSSQTRDQSRSRCTHRAISRQNQPPTKDKFFHPKKYSFWELSPKKEGSGDSISNWTAESKLISDIIKYHTLDAPCHLVYAYFAPNIPSHGKGVMAKKQIFQQHRSIFYLFLKQAKRQESCVDEQYHYTAHLSYTETYQLIRTESEKREYNSSCIHNPKSCRMLSFSTSNTAAENGETWPSKWNWLPAQSKQESRRQKPLEKQLPNNPRLTEVRACKWGRFYRALRNEVQAQGAQ